MIQKINYKDTYYLYYGAESLDGKILIVLYRIEKMNGEDVTSFVDRHDWEEFTTWIESGGAN